VITFDRLISEARRVRPADAKLIFMDEPTASLTQAETDHLLAVVRTLSASGVAVVFVSHRLAEVLDVSNRVTVLRHGRLVGVYDAAGMTQSRLTELMTRKLLDNAASARDVHNAPTVVETVGLTRRGEYTDVNQQLRAGGESWPRLSARISASDKWRPAGLLSLPHRGWDGGRA
jgi:simple sugar transport system ATP-binding protein